MKLTLDAAEVARAIQVYVARKAGNLAPEEFKVTLHWRGRTATAERIRTQPPIPVLTEVADLIGQPCTSIPVMRKP
jgi:hypothetical protein